MMIIAFFVSFFPPSSRMFVFPYFIFSVLFMFSAYTLEGCQLQPFSFYLLSACFVVYSFKTSKVSTLSLKIMGCSVNHHYSSDDNCKVDKGKNYQHQERYLIFRRL